MWVRYTKSYVACGLNMSIYGVRFVAAMSIQGENVESSYILEIFIKS